MCLSFVWASSGVVRCTSPTEGQYEADDVASVNMSEVKVKVRDTVRRSGNGEYILLHSLGTWVPT